MAVLLAIALFVAQAINFTLLLHERRSLILEQTSGPAIARLNDAIERAASGKPLPPIAGGSGPRRPIRSGPTCRACPKWRPSFAKGWSNSGIRLRGS
ncbi:hypothetical protein GCM10020258_48130 [Sphingomonas yabuuchiae]